MRKEHLPNICSLSLSSSSFRLTENEWVIIFLQGRKKKVFKVKKEHGKWVNWWSSEKLRWFNREQFWSAKNNARFDVNKLGCLFLLLSFLWRMLYMLILLIRSTGHGSINIFLPTNTQKRQSGILYTFFMKPFPSYFSHLNQKEIMERGHLLSCFLCENSL